MTQEHKKRRVLSQIFSFLFSITVLAPVILYKTFQFMTVSNMEKDTSLLFPQNFGITIASCTTPPQMITWFDPRNKFNVCFQFSCSRQFFLHGFSKVSNIKLGSDFRMAFRKKDRTWMWRSVPIVVKFRWLYFSNKHPSPSFSILFEFATVPTWTTTKSMI